MASGFLNVTWDSFSDPPGFGGIFTDSFWVLELPGSGFFEDPGRIFGPS